MKKTAFVFLLSLAWSLGFGQTEASIDGLKHQLGKAEDDTSRILKMALICHHYGYQNYDSSIVYARRALALLERNNFPRGKARVFFGLGCTYLLSGDISRAMSILLDGLQLAKKNQCKIEEVSCLMAIGFCYQRLNDSKAIEFFRRAKLASKKTTQREGLDFVVLETEVNLGIAFGLNKQLDSAQHHLQIFADTTSASTWRAVALTALAEVLIRKEEPQMALKCLNESFALDVKNNDDYSTMWASLALSNLYKNLNKSDSCIFYAQKGFMIAQKLGIKEGMMRSSLIMAEQHEKTDLKKSIHYHQIYEGLYKELYGVDKIVALQKILLQEQERQRKVESDQLAYQNRVKQYGFLAGFAMLLSLALILYRNNRQKQKANAVLEKTLSTLQSTQAQLIQSEKLASLGELTAGIAHEIQNPLNFVNNFAEVSAEMLDEMHEELEKGDTTEAIAIATDLKTNLEKINHHGQRASSIVKGMLEHSRASTGVKEPTDLNALADEYLRLAYHGLRAKDNNFNATMETHFDPDLPKVSVIPQDIGRVLLNLINNAFYAVAERSRSTIGAPLAGAQASYMPTVTVSTKKLENAIEIRVEDNGNGIPEAIREKIFQPFFTTKPTGQGTGLGLSLAYDIVVKGHGGRLDVETEDAEGTTLVVKLTTQSTSI